MRPSHPASRATATSEGDTWPCLCDLCWPNTEARWHCGLVGTMASSSPLSEEHDEAELELMSMDITDSESWGHCGEEGLELDGESGAEDEEGEGLVSLLRVSMGRGGGLWWPFSML